MKKKKTTKTLSRYKKQLDKWFSLYIRLKNTDKNGKVKCYTCGKVDNWKNMQCGHFFSRTHLSTRWDENNCRVQCYACNVMRHGNYIIYTKKMLKELGEKKFEELEQKAYSVKRWSKQELEEMLEFYKNEVKKLKEKLGIN